MNKKRSDVKYFWILLTIIFLVIFGFLFYKINKWFNGHYFAFNFPIKIDLLQPIAIKNREPQIIEKKLVLEYPEEIDTPLEQYICDKFGVYDCKTALAVSKAENGDRIPDKFNVNSNGTIDVGIFQINSIHFTEEGCALKEIVDPIRNVDCAWRIWQTSGWGPWVAFHTGAFLNHL